MRKEGRVFQRKNERVNKRERESNIRERERESNKLTSVCLREIGMSMS